MAETGLRPLPSKLVAPPRIEGAPVHLECKLHEIIDLPGHDAVSTHQVVFGVVVYIANDAITDEGIFDVGHRLLSRLGYKDYAWTDDSVIFQMEKRTPEDTFASSEPWRYRLQRAADFLQLLGRCATTAPGGSGWGQKFIHSKAVNTNRYCV